MRTSRWTRSNSNFFGSRVIRDFSATLNYPPVKEGRAGAFSSISGTVGPDAKRKKRKKAKAAPSTGDAADDKVAANETANKSGRQR